MDLIVAVCRALANKPRLRLLRAIHEQPGSSVDAVAERAKMPADAASKHLKLLRGLHLIRMTPSGRFVRCAPASAEITNNEFLRGIQRLLAEVFGGRDLNCTRAQVCDSTSIVSRGWNPVFDALLKHATAFTHLRRLLMLRTLASKGPCRLEELASNIGMSPDAARRHLDKLRRRGVIAGDPKTSGAWTLIRAPQPPCLQKLLAIVLRAAGKL
jgi:DNA-binding transcriptional ArsR family regulator